MLIGCVWGANKVEHIICSDVLIALLSAGDRLLGGALAAIGWFRPRVLNPNVSGVMKLRNLLLQSSCICRILMGVAPEDTLQIHKAIAVGI